MENKTKTPPFKSLRIDLFDYNELIDPKNLLSGEFSDTILSYLNQGVKVFLSVEGNTVRELTKNDF